jgi:nitrile hydratase beta subunit
MDGIHDLGGREGFGPIRWQADEHGQAFHQAWQARTWAICMCMFAKWRGDGNGWTLDWWRHVIERIEPTDYLAMNYFDKWVQSCMAVLIDDGTADIRDFVGDGSKLRSGDLLKPDKQAQIRQALPVAGSAGGGASRATFRAGDHVKAKLSVGAMHTRLPAYARGRDGLVSECHGMQILPDASARGEMRKEHLYTVAFMASTLWPEAPESKDKVYIDLWESYIEPA